MTTRRIIAKPLGGVNREIDYYHPVAEYDSSGLHFSRLLAVFFAEKPKPILGSVVRDLSAAARVAR
ncbi:hypothetical protein [Edwardsiella tarda]